MACHITLYNDAKLEDGMLRAGAMIALLGVAVICAGCSKCASPFGHLGACHSDGPSLGLGDQRCRESDKKPIGGDIGYA